MAGRRESTMTNGEIALMINQLQKTVGEVLTELKIQNSRISKSESEIAVLKDRSEKAAEAVDEIAVLKDRSDGAKAVGALYGGGVAGGVLAAWELAKHFTGK